MNISTRTAVRPVTVLYVEDEEYDQYFMRLAFKRAGSGLHLKEVADGQEAIDYLAGNRKFQDREQYPLPDLLLLDLNLPHVSGFELLEWVKGQLQFESLPIVVFTSSHIPTDKARAINLGADAYVEKPSSAMQFHQIVEVLKQRWLPGNGSSGSATQTTLALLSLAGLLYRGAHRLGCALAKQRCAFLSHARLTFCKRSMAV